MIIILKRRSMKTKSMKKSILPVLFAALSMVILMQCTTAPAWQKKNSELIKQYDLTVRKLHGLPDTKIVSNLEPGKVTNLDSIATTLLYPGVNAKIYWGKGTMVSILRLDPNATIPKEVLPSDRFVFVLEGSIDQLIDGSFVTMIARKRGGSNEIRSATPRIDFVYLEKGSKNALTAGPSGAELVEVYSPVRLDYLQKAGVTNGPAGTVDISDTQIPNVEPNKVYDLYDLQLTALGPGSNSRLVNGRNTHISFLSAEPGAVFNRHIHPEENIMLVLRGGCNMMILDREQEMSKNDVVLVPGNMVHGAAIGPLGCDAIDIFWPARTDYMSKEKARMEAYHAIIPEDAKLELVIDGRKTKPALVFTEGPKWFNGKLYFSNMFFDEAFVGSPEKSSTVVMDPDGTYRNITEGKMQTNGLYPYKNGNLLVCDMMGHRLIEMTTTGQVVKVLADKYNGKSLDGPNDMVTDTKGGIYFTDPQYTNDRVKNQPGPAVYYLSPDGKLTRLFEPNKYVSPNGILLSPDGKTLYINNTCGDVSWYEANKGKENYIWAYDVNEDGTVGNGRLFAKLFVTEDVLDRGGRATGADGMSIDKMGNIYVATSYGVQIFNSKGEYVGMINLPTYPVNLCFGDDDMKTLYIVSYSWVFKIHTNMEGFVQYL
jgi:gluconolactonase